MGQQCCAKRQHSARYNGLKAQTDTSTPSEHNPAPDSDLAQDIDRDSVKPLDSLQLHYTNLNPENFYFAHGNRYLVHHDTKVWYDHPKRESIALALTQSVTEFFTFSFDDLIDIICDYAYDKNNDLSLIVPMALPIATSLSSSNAARGDVINVSNSNNSNNSNNWNDDDAFRDRYDINYSPDGMIIYATLNDINRWRSKISGCFGSLNLKNKYVLLNNCKEIMNNNFDNEYCVYQFCFKTFRKKEKLTPWQDHGMTISPDLTRECFTFQIGIFLLDDHDSSHVDNDMYNHNDDEGSFRLSDCINTSSEAIGVKNIYYGWQYKLEEYETNGELCDCMHVVEYVDHGHLWKRKNYKYDTCDIGTRRKYHNYDTDLLQENEYLLFEIDMKHSRMVLAGQTFLYIKDIPPHIINFLLNENSKGKFCIGAGFEKINCELADYLGIGLVRINFDYYCKMFPTHLQYVKEKTKPMCIVKI